MGMRCTSKAVGSHLVQSFNTTLNVVDPGHSNVFGLIFFLDTNFEVCDNSLLDYQCSTDAVCLGEKKSIERAMPTKFAVCNLSHELYEYNLVC